MKVCLHTDKGVQVFQFHEFFWQKKITKGEKYHEIMFHKKRGQKKKNLNFTIFSRLFFWYLFQHAGRNSTNCWYWIHGTTTIKPLEFYSKLPFEWLGPFTPQLMKLIKFESPDAIANPMGTNVISKLLLLWFFCIIQCLKITQNVAFEIFKFGIFHQFLHY